MKNFVLSSFVLFISYTAAAGFLYVIELVPETSEIRLGDGKGTGSNLPIEWNDSFSLPAGFIDVRMTYTAWDTNSGQPIYLNDQFFKYGQADPFRPRTNNFNITGYVHPGINTIKVKCPRMRPTYYPNEYDDFSFNNVVVIAEYIPEPCTLFLMGLGGLLIKYRTLCR